MLLGPAASISDARIAKEFFSSPMNLLESKRLIQDEEILLTQSEAKKRILKMRSISTYMIRKWPPLELLLKDKSHLTKTGSKKTR
ncbi:hypothetical protein [Gillisia hiemivivida]|uniref:Uncharacterized protein n=1 Tax=Gillisia hiemivivida TaxID=291190 RepID=A0A5C6ZQR0_9FLAO|nr:hypothetical protein [Gillisia hiemivivida]TXD92151.1 hypothetical protein ES724_14670 [Gillisia hiemivivida]